MPTNSIERPAADEYTPYYGPYIALVPEGDLLAHLEAQHRDTAELIQRNRDRADFAYGPGKWTVKEVLGHLADGERVFSYRAMRFARADRTDLPGFDENAFVEHGNFGARTVDDLVDELRAVRASTIAMARGLATETLTRRGNANGKAITVRALLYICAGHERHHVGLLRERYGLR